MNLYEFSEEFRISIHKSRKMEKAGVLLLDSGESEHGAEIRFQLSRGQSLTVAQLLAILEEPSILCELGRYRDKAESQLAALGNAREEAAPFEVAAHIMDAALRRDAEAVGVLIGWMKAVIPAEPVNHYWIAVRMLMGLQPNIRKYDVPRIGRALLNCRNSPDFAGWWHVEKFRSRRVTLYQKPGMLFDL